MEAELKKKEVGKATSHHSDFLFTTGDPFSEEIMQAEVPKNFKCPEMTLYDGSSDPRHHLSNFRSRMSIAYFDDFTKGFLTHFSIQKEKFKHAPSLLGVKQGGGESLRALHGAIQQSLLRDYQPTYRGCSDGTCERTSGQTIFLVCVQATSNFHCGDPRAS
ncbi:hypothetical protein PIB30_035081 [Stylosanthes scabra]|uniref:Uncharacterized protein n=1 Tax=Stylosanthes scabra TaxID=79078 RepID=A0ABU6QCL7_9FABA|nr:hypothetical protein [Stylosanthes scabra]